VAEPRGRRGFGLATLAALAAGTTCAVAGTRAAVEVDAEGQAAAMVTAGTAQGDALTMPLVTSLALVALASWGVLLVTRGVVRRSAAALALLASLGLLAAAAAALGDLRGTVEDALTEVGATGGAGVTGWYLAAVVGGVVLVLTAGLAVWQVPAWPEMGRRYDSPTGEERAVTADPESPLDLWRAMDEGHDPTDRTSP
jgi:hypothetical protein